jgi:cytochrome c553
VPHREFVNKLCQRNIVKKILKWLGIVVVGVVSLALLGFAYIYFASEHELGRRYTTPEAATLVLPTDAAQIAEGARFAHLVGCTHCHGENLTGAVPLDIPNVVRFVAPNLTQALPQYSDAELITLLRRGVKRDGTGVYFMPSAMFRHLRDQDLARIIAYVRSVPAAQGVTGKTEVRPVGRFIIATGQFQSAARDIEDLAPDTTPVDIDDPKSQGRYLVMNLCTECHGQDLKGDENAHSPSLAVVKTYPLQDFERLMHDGVGLGSRRFELMTPTAKGRFSHLTADEVQAMHAFLKSRTES